MDCVCKPQNSAFADVPCGSSHSLGWLLLKLVPVDQYGGVERAQVYTWIDKLWCVLIVSLSVNYYLDELQFPRWENRNNVSQD